MFDTIVLAVNHNKALNRDNDMRRAATVLIQAGDGHVDGCLSADGVYLENFLFLKYDQVHLLGSGHRELGAYKQNYLDKRMYAFF